MTGMRPTTLVVLLAAATAAAQAADDAASNGAGLYYEYGCYACHGYNGTGRVPLSADTSGILADESVFLRYLRLRGDQNPVNPKNTMPNYSAGTLSDANALSIYAYLRSLRDEAPSVEDIPAFMELLEHAQRGPSDESEEN
jgi:mono/diheme cytochrome c family protein